METTTTLSLGFDYDSIPDISIRATLRSEATAIKVAVKRTHDNIIEIGNRLTLAKEIAGHGKFLEWVSAEFDMSRQMAWQFMNVAQSFANVNNNLHLNLPQSALFALSSPSVPEEVRAEAVELAQAGEIKTVADTKAFIQHRIESPRIETTNPEPEPYTPPTYSELSSPSLRAQDGAIRDYEVKKQAFNDTLNNLSDLRECAEFFLKNRKALEREPAKMDIYCSRLRKALK